MVVECVEPLPQRMDGSRPRSSTHASLYASSCPSAHLAQALPATGPQARRPHAGLRQLTVTTAAWPCARGIPNRKFALHPQPPSVVVDGRRPHREGPMSARHRGRWVGCGMHPAAVAASLSWGAAGPSEAKSAEIDARQASAIGHGGETSFRRLVDNAI